jgi:pre-mRNA-processing factor 39
VGLDFLSHPFWDKYIEFEERMEQRDKIFAILSRIVAIPMHQYARYYERYSHLANSQPVAALVPAQVLTQLQMDVENEGMGFKSGNSQAEVDRELRQRINTYHLETFRKTQAETTKRWTYESEIKRPYFHITDLDESQLANWRKYLDFEEAEGDFARIQFLYERCLVTCAQHEEFWLRYARWMLAQAGKDEEVRNIYQRASTIFVPIALPETRLHYAYFEEMSDRVDVAKDIHDAILVQLPSHIETIVSLANLSRRHGTVDDAVAVYKTQIENPLVDVTTKAALVAEWAKTLWRVKSTPGEGRQVFKKHQPHYNDSDAFWRGWLAYEISQPGNFEGVKKVVIDILGNPKLGERQQLVTMYMDFLLERGDKDAAREFLTLDRDINGPGSVKRAVVPMQANGKGR